MRGTNITCLLTQSFLQDGLTIKRFTNAKQLIKFLENVTFRWEVSYFNCELYIVCESSFTVARENHNELTISSKFVYLKLVLSFFHVVHSGY